MFFVHEHGVIMRVFDDTQLKFERAWCYSHFPTELTFFADLGIAL